MRCFLVSEGTATRARETVVSRLAKFFPAASPLRIPIRLTRLEREPAASENTVIEYGTAREIFFASALSLEFAEKLRIQNSDNSLDVEVQVVAVQFHEGHMAVAARFLGEVLNWILKG